MCCTRCVCITDDTYYAFRRSREAVHSVCAGGVRECWDYIPAWESGGRKCVLMGGGGGGVFDEEVGPGML